MIWNRRKRNNIIFMWHGSNNNCWSMIDGFEKLGDNNFGDFDLDNLRYDY